MPYFVPWKSKDVVNYGRAIWNRRKHWQRRYGIFTSHSKWVVEPAMAPLITAYGVLVSKVWHKEKVGADLMSIYGGFTHDLANLLAKEKWNETNRFGKKIASVSWVAGTIGYRFAHDLWNKANARSIRAIVSAATRLAESNLSSSERSRIESMIRQSSNMVCIYDFSSNRLYKPY